MKTILIVEDDAVLLESSANFLSYHLPHCNVVAVDSGKKALESIEQAIPDLILLDLILPDYSYQDLLQKINEKMAPLVPNIVIVSGSKDSKESALKLPGVLGFHCKPQSFQSVVEIARIILKP
jgi:CheY-like chemotaxis protein